VTAGDLSLGEYRAAKLNLLAGIEAQLERIATNTGHADVHLSEEQVASAWEGRGIRMYGDEVIATLRDLGIEVD
jgi:hypothetical protein